MVFFNYATMQMAAKIVYYGPGLCGKTTNLHYIYQKTSPQSRGEMVSLETETDRTLFFDLLPIDVGVIGGFKTRLQLYTVPGQVFYNTTRKLVLKGADGIVFVADSQRAMADANLESLANLRENLAEIGLELDEIPLVLQLNKRDLPNIVPREELQKLLDPEGKHEAVESSAVSGQGVFETLKLISKLTLKNLRKRMMGEESATKIAPIVREHGLTTPPAASTPITKPKSEPAPPAAVIAPPPAKAPSPAPVSRPAAAATAAPAQQVAVVAEPLPVEVPKPEPPKPEPAALPQPPKPAVVEASTPASTPPPPALAVAPIETPEVKHVKVRSSIDVLAELDSLRKKATTQGAKKKETSPLDALNALGAGVGSKKTSKSIGLKAQGAAATGTRRVRITVQMEDDGRNAIQVEEQIVDVPESSDQLQVNLKIDFGQGQ